MLRKILSLALVFFVFIGCTSCFAEKNESSENSLLWFEALLSAFSEPEPAREPIYGSLDDKACTATYVEVEYVFRDILKDAKTDVYSIYFIVACLAAQEIEDTLYNPDSNLYQKVGRNEYKLSLNYLFGKNPDTESDSFDESMKYIRRYFMQESVDACGAFYDDLVEFGYIDVDNNGEMDLRTRKYASEIGISQGAVYAILEEFNLYQSNPIEGLKK